MPRDLTFVYKRELNWLPFFGWGIASAQMISIDRSKGQDAFEQVVEQGIDRLGRGWWIVIFPEGTRTPPGSTKRYKTGGRAPRGAHRRAGDADRRQFGRVWPSKAFLKRPGTDHGVDLPADRSGAARRADEVGALVEGVDRDRDEASRAASLQRRRIEPLRAAARRRRSPRQAPHEASSAMSLRATGTDCSWRSICEGTTPVLRRPGLHARRRYVRASGSAVSGNDGRSTTACDARAGARSASRSTTRA